MGKNFTDRDGFIWFNGEFIPWRDAQIHLINQGLHYGSAVFEGERAYNGKIFKSEQHTDRLFKSAEIIGMEIPYSKDEIISAKKKLLEKMKLENCYLRPLVWRGGNQMGISTTYSDINVSISAWEDWTSYFKMEDRLAGIKLITSPWKRPAPDSSPYEAKSSGVYVICTMSKEFAEKKGFHDALMLDHRNYVAEGTGANIFFIKGNKIDTPIPDCFLNGITRQVVIKMLKKQGYIVEEKHMHPEEISSYDEAFLTGTAAEITPISIIDNNEFIVGENTTTFKLMNDFGDLVKHSL
jgi:branched-chain amino acid aminotransferase